MGVLRSDSGRGNLARKKKPVVLKLIIVRPKVITAVNIVEYRPVAK
jgi:hypothetical protein